MNMVSHTMLTKQHNIIMTSALFNTALDVDVIRQIHDMKMDLQHRDVVRRKMREVIDQFCVITAFLKFYDAVPYDNRHIPWMLNELRQDLYFDHEFIDQPVLRIRFADWVLQQDRRRRLPPRRRRAEVTPSLHDVISSQQINFSS